ncbi:hypothetical protein ACFLY0_00230 [Patescibacteria group bacterium]
MKNKLFVIMILVLALFVGGCSSTNHHGEGIVAGVTAGGVAGYKLGGGDPWAIAVGAAIGGLIGGEVGEEIPKEDGVEERNLAIENRQTYNKRMAVDGYTECVQSGFSSDYCAGLYSLQPKR